MTRFRPAVPLQLFEHLCPAQLFWPALNKVELPGVIVAALQGNDQVAVVNPDGKAEIRAVKVGQLYGRNMIVVTRGAQNSARPE
jgi:hypothetical protein